MPDPPRILVVDDDADTLLLLEEILTKEGYRVRTAEHAEAALSLASQEEPDVVVTDIQMPGMDGLALLAELQRRLPQTLVVLATAFGSLKTAVDGIKAGAFDYLGKPFVVDDIRLVVRRAIEHKRVINENAALREQLKERYRFDNFVGSSTGMIAVYKMIARVAQSDSTVLIQGESGTGKELVARAIHANSTRSAGPFVAVDAGTLAESLLESELFGHERGSFTGALTTKKGLLERAHSGTCFLDEIADISPTLQSKLLRVIQEHEIRRVGGSDPISVDVRILAASNKDLKGLVDAGKFRGDLYYRLNVVTISTPPLRERADDIPLLAQFFAQKYGAAQGKPAIGISPDAMDLITKYGWPGNVRELEHVIERAVVLTPHPVIFPEDLPEALREKPIADSQPHSGWVTLDQLERDYILRALAAHQQDQAKTADLLGIHRKTLQRKLRKYGLAEAGAMEEGSTADEPAVEQEESI